MSNLQGTTVPSNAFVEKVYINVDLSIEEVVSIIDSANLTYDFFSKYTVVDGIEISNMLGKTIIVNNEIVFRESDAMNTGVFVGWKEGFNGIVAVNKQNSYGTQNDALSSLFSITPLTQPQDGQVIVSKSKLTAIADNIRNQTGTTGLITLDEMAKMKLGGGATITTKGGWQGTPVPNTGYVENVYFNTALSVEEVVSIIDNANLTYEFDSMELIITEDGKNLTKTIIVGKLDTFIFIVVDSVFVFSNEINEEFDVDFVGWKSDFNGIYEFNDIADSFETSDVGTITLGANNDKLSSLFSTTPFTQAEGGSITLEGEYDGSSIEVTENGSLDIKALIENKQIPLEVNVNVPIGITPTGTYEVTENGEYDITQYAKVNVNVAGSGGGENTLKKLLDLTKSTSYMFYNNKTITDLTGYINYDDTENVENTSHMYSGCSALITAPQINISKVTNTYRMFFNCTSLITAPPLNTSKVSNIESMYQGCSVLTTIQSLNTSETTAITSLFYNCYELITVPPLDTSKVKNIGQTFYNCYKIPKIELSYLYVSISSYSSYAFCNCYSLKTVIIRSFGTSYALNSNAFNNCYHLTGTQNTTYNPTGAKDGYIYVPRNMVDTLKSATNWSTYADQIRALEDYTVDGTTTGELDESKI